MTGRRKTAATGQPRFPEKRKSIGLPTSLEFFGLLRWLDGRPLIDTIEPYRRKTFTELLDTKREDGTPKYNFGLLGRGKKNWKSCDLVLCGFYKLLVPHNMQGNQCFIVANDEEQAGDDLQLAKKLVQCNPVLQAELKIERKRIIRKDGRGSLDILPAKDSAGAHGKTSIFLGFDELHAYRDYELIEALQPDPTQRNSLVLVASYDTFHSRQGVPLFDYKLLGKSGDDPRMYFSWYSADFTTDPAAADLDPEARANPSMSSWPEGRAYLEQQKRRLPFFKFRRLHLNLPGVPDGSVFDPDLVLAAIVKGRRALHPEDILTADRSARPKLHAFVDMSGGSNDDAVLGIAFRCADTKKVVLCSLMSQTGKPPFSPREAVVKFVSELKRWGLSSVSGDAYAGLTFPADFRSMGINYIASDRTASGYYEAFEVLLNAGEVELLDIQKLQDQLLGLVIRGTKIDHLPTEHDDWSNAAAGAVVLAADAKRAPMQIHPDVMKAALAGPGQHWRSPARQFDWPGATADAVFPSRIVGSE